MINNDKPEFFSRLNGLMEIFGKAKLTTAAAQIWWDTVRDLDHNDAFTAIGYWAQSHSKAPTPMDIWTIANDARTNRIEAKAEKERAENRDPFGTHWTGPTEYGREMIRMINDMLRRTAHNTRESKWPISMRPENRPWAKRVDRLP